MSTVFPYQKSVRTHATKHATNRVGKTILKNCQILENVLGISSFLLQYQDFLHLKSDFPHLKSNFPCTKSDLPKSAFYFLRRLSAFFNGFPLSSTAFRFLQRLSEFLQRLSNFPQRLSAFREVRENLFMARSIRKIAIRVSYFSPLAPRALWLLINNTYVITQHTPVVHLCSQQCAISKI